MHVRDAGPPDIGSRAGRVHVRLPRRVADPRLRRGVGQSVARQHERLRDTRSRGAREGCQSLPARGSGGRRRVRHGRAGEPPRQNRLRDAVYLCVDVWARISPAIRDDGTRRHVAATPRPRCRSSARRAPLRLGRRVAASSDRLRRRRTTRSSTSGRQKSSRPSTPPFSAPRSSWSATGAAPGCRAPRRACGERGTSRSGPRTSTELQLCRRSGPSRSTPASATPRRRARVSKREAGRGPAALGATWIFRGRIVGRRTIPIPAARGAARLPPPQVLPTHFHSALHAHNTPLPSAFANAGPLPMASCWGLYPRDPMSPWRRVEAPPPLATTLRKAMDSYGEPSSVETHRVGGDAIPFQRRDATASAATIPSQASSSSPSRVSPGRGRRRRSRRCSGPFRGPRPGPRFSPRRSCRPRRRKSFARNRYLTTKRAAPTTSCSCSGRTGASWSAPAPSRCGRGVPRRVFAPAPSVEFAQVHDSCGHTCGCRGLRRVPDAAVCATERTWRNRSAAERDAFFATAATTAATRPLPPTCPPDRRHRDPHYFSGLFHNEIQFENASVCPGVPPPLHRARTNRRVRRSTRS